MNRLNPIYVGASLFVILLFFIVKLNSAKSELIEAKENFAQTDKLAIELSTLKGVYSNKPKVQKDLQKILRQSALSSATITQKQKSGGVMLSCESMELLALNTLVGKLLNSSFNISTLKIKRLSDEKASLEVEIKW